MNKLPTLIALQLTEIENELIHRNFNWTLATGLELTTMLANVGKTLDTAYPIFPTLSAHQNAKYSTWKVSNPTLVTVFSEADWLNGMMLIKNMRIEHAKNGKEGVGFKSIMGDTKVHCMYWSGTGKTNPAIERAKAAGLANPEGKQKAKKGAAKVA